MARLPFHVAIIFSMIAGCIGPRDVRMKWPKSVDEKLLNIFYKTLPQENDFWKRVKEEWDIQVPKYKEMSIQKLAGRVRKLQNRYYKKWRSYPPTEREYVDNLLVHIYHATNNRQPKHEERMLDMFLGSFPRYRYQPELIRTVVYQWYNRCAPLGKEILAKDVDWTPQREAYLQHIAKQAANEGDDIPGRIKRRWLEKYIHLNVTEPSLLNHAYELTNEEKLDPTKRKQPKRKEKNKSQLVPEEVPTQEQGSVTKGKRQYWSSKMNAYVMYIAGKVLRSGGDHLAAIKDRWDKLQQNHTHLSAEELLERAKFLDRHEYMPKIEDFQEAEARYKALPPLPPEICPVRTGRRTSRPLQIREGQEPNQQHLDELDSLDLKLNSQEKAWIRQGTGTNHTSRTGYAHFPHETYYHGSSSHIPTDQGPHGSQPNTPRPHQQFYDFFGSSSHTPTDQVPSESLPNTPHPHQQFWHPGGSSSHTTIHQYPFGSQLDTPHPYQGFWYPGEGSSYTSIHQDQTGPLPDTPRPDRFYRNQGDTSRHSRR